MCPGNLIYNQTCTLMMDMIENNNNNSNSNSVALAQDSPLSIVDISRIFLVVNVAMDRIWN